MSTNSKKLVYNKSLDSQFGNCDFYVDEDRKYHISLSDFYGHLETVVILEREEFLDLINAVTLIIGKHAAKKSEVTKKRIIVSVELIDENQMISLGIAKEQEWSITILFYNNVALDDFVEELEKMASY